MGGEELKVTVIGVGRMGGALVERLLASGFRVVVYDIVGERLRWAEGKGARAARDPAEAAGQGEVVVLAVKPAQIGQVVPTIRKRLTARHLLVSIAAGVRLATLQRLAPGVKVIRAMPNLAALVGAAATCLALGEGVGEEELAKARRVFAVVGEVFVVEEGLMDAVTALSGSGPAYVARFLEALSEGGMAAGLPGELAYRLALQTLLGAAKLLWELGYSPEELVGMVATPGGTTEAGLKAMGELKGVVKAGIVAAKERSVELSRG
jgi:pyrroline-5-carboxylate reductase